MTHRNRVAPDGEITAEQYRGRWMGNRGGAISFGPHRQHWVSKHWIYCLLSFKDRTRVLGDPSRKYTELFFFDEAVALAAGHRPCGECQHQRLREFKRRSIDRGVNAIDEILHQQRRGPRDVAAVGSLPFGTFVAGPTLLTASGAFRWTPAHGYRQIDSLPGDTEVEVLTPALIRTALANGFVPTVSVSG